MWPHNPTHGHTIKTHTTQSKPMVPSMAQYLKIHHLPGNMLLMIRNDKVPLLHINMSRALSMIALWGGPNYKWTKMCVIFGISKIRIIFTIWSNNACVHALCTLHTFEWVGKVVAPPRKPHLCRVHNFEWVGEVVKPIKKNTRKPPLIWPSLSHQTRGPIICGILTPISQTSSNMLTTLFSNIENNLTL